MRLINSLVSAVRRLWEAIRNHKVAEEILRAKVDLKRLREERKILNEQRRSREQEIAGLQTPEIIARHKLRQGNAQACVCGFLVLAILGSVYWTFSHVGPGWQAF